VIDFSVLEQELGYKFADLGRLGQAFIHSSRSGPNYERLEFLGDRVLGLAMAEWLLELHPEAPEGKLAKLQAALVSAESLAQVARSLDLSRYIKGAAADPGLKQNDGILADCCEALVAALYLDGGLPAAQNFIRTQWRDLVSAPPETGDAKTLLQEWTQSRGLGLPIYSETERSGPDHAPSFIIEVQVKNHGAVAATGASKRLAERAAAAAMLKELTK
jgi:ribonuclease-3